MVRKKKSLEELLKNFSFDPPPEGFVIAKPIQYGEYDEEEVYELERQNRLIITRKHNGWKLFAVKANDNWKIYTDSMREVTSHLPHIVEELNTLKITNESMLIGEGVADINISDNSMVGKILNTKDAWEAREKQKEFGLIKFVCFDVAFGGGKCFLQTTPYHERLTTLLVTIGSRHNHIGAVEIVRATCDEAKALALKNNWEGLVFYDKEFLSSFRLDGGNPKRPDGCYKWKPMYEGDFIIRNLVPSKKGPEDFKEILLLQIDPKTGKEIDCGKHGVFSKEDREEIQTLFRKNRPFVVQFEYETRTINNKLTNKRFVGIRHDKKWQDCILPTKIFPKNMK